MKPRQIRRRPARWNVILFGVLLGALVSVTQAAPLPFHGAVPSSQAETDTQLADEEAKLRAALARTPNDVTTLSRLGTVLAMENKSTEAIAIFEKAVKLAPADAKLRRSLATAYWQSGKPEKARKNLEMVLKAAPGDPLATLLLGMVLADLKEYPSSAKLLSAVPQLVRQRPETALALARDYYRIGETAKARGTLEMLAEPAAAPQAAFQAGQVAAESADYETAEKFFQGIQDTYPDAAAANYNLALAQYSSRKYEECRNTLTASIAAGHASAASFGLLGWCYEKLDKMNEMLAAFEKAVNSDPSDITYYLELGDALLEKRNYGTALEVAKEAEKRFPAKSGAYRLKGAAQLRMYLLTDALESYTKAVELDPNDPKAALGLALVQWNMNRDEEAQKSFEAAARRFPNDGFVQLKYALFLLNSPGERGPAEEQKVMELLKKSVQLDDTLAETHYQLGNLALRHENYQEALKELQTAAQLDPEASKTHFLLARAYRRTGDDEAAERETLLHRKLKEKEDKENDPNAPRGTARR